MIELGTGDLLEADVEGFVNPVNTVGVMGKGLAKKFMRRYPENFLAYSVACQRGDVRVGRMFVTRTLTCYLINFPTKADWRDGSRLEYIQDGLVALVDEVRTRRIASIAVPALGCGLGALWWGDVRPLIASAAELIPEVRVVVFPPQGP